MIRSFTGWRYIFAVAIFMHHYQIDGKSVLQAGGVIGVTFFFILSGFLLAYGYKKRLMTREISTSDFYKARAVKLYPLHILCFAAVFLLGIRNFVTADLPKAVLNLFLLQSWVPSPDYYMSYNAVSWFLSDELFFYLMFPFVLPVLLNGSGKKIAVGVGIFAISYSAAAALIPSDHYHAYFYINPLSRFADFVFGILVFRIFDQRRQATVGHTSRAEAGAILLVFATFILFDHIPKPYHYCSVIFWGPVAMLIYIFANTSLSANYPPHTRKIHYVLHKSVGPHRKRACRYKPDRAASFRKDCPVAPYNCSVKPVFVFIWFINKPFCSDVPVPPRPVSTRTTCWPYSSFSCLPRSAVWLA